MAEWDPAGDLPPREPCDHKGTPLIMPDARCGRSCGHRVISAAGDVPVETRKLHWSLWPFEVVSRAEAKLRSWLYRTGRADLRGRPTGQDGLDGRRARG